MTLTERYEQIKAEMPMSPARAFLLEIADVTKKSELTVRRWLSGESTPDALTQEVLAKHFNTTPDTLFPKPI